MGHKVIITVTSSSTDELMREDLARGCLLSVCIDTPHRLVRNISSSPSSSALLFYSSSTFLLLFVYSSVEHLTSVERGVGARVEIASKWVAFVADHCAQRAGRGRCDEATDAGQRLEFLPDVSFFYLTRPEAIQNRPVQ
jgi:hypothetical protein